MGKKQRDYSDAGNVIAAAVDLKGWSLTKLCGLTGIAKSRMDRIVKGARIRYEDGLKLEDVLGLERGRLSDEYRSWVAKRRKAG